LGLAIAAYWLPEAIAAARELVNELQFELERICTVFGMCGTDASGARWSNA
jgi:hypothetical protein